MLVWMLVLGTCYVSALVVEGVRRRVDHPAASWGAWALAAVGLAVHSIYLAVRAGRADVPPLLASPHDWLLVLSWLVVLTLVVAGRVLPHVSLGTHLLPPAVAIVVVAAFVRDDAGQRLHENYWWVLAHSAFVVLGLAGTVLAFVTSLMYLAQHRRLKRRRPLASGARLLDLERLSRINWWCVVLAVPLITVGFAMGFALILASENAAAAVPPSQPAIIVLAVLWVGVSVLMGWLLLHPAAGGTAVAVRTAWASGFVLLTVLSLTVLQPGGGVHSTRDEASATRPPGATGVNFDQADANDHADARGADA